MKIYSAVEQPSRILGIALGEFALLMILLALPPVLLTFLGGGSLNYGWIYLANLIMIGLLFAFFRRAGVKGNPTYLLSLYAFYLLQPQIEWDHVELIEQKNKEIL